MFDFLSKYKSNLFSSGIASILSAVPFIVIYLFFSIPTNIELVKEKKVQNPKTAIESVEKIAQFFYKKVQSGEMSEKDAKKMALDTMEELRYSGNEYFFVNEVGYNSIMHPFSKKILSLRPDQVKNFKDKSGVYLFQEMEKVALSKGRGFVEYSWDKPGSDKPVGKTAYVGYFRPWKWIIGTGVYVDDVEAAVSEIRSDSILIALGATFFALVISFGNAVRNIKGFVLPVEEASNILYNQSKSLSEKATSIMNSSKLLSQNVEGQSSALHQYNRSLDQAMETTNNTLSNTDTSYDYTVQTRSKIEVCQKNVNGLNSSLTKVLDNNMSIIGQVEKSFMDLENFKNQLDFISDKTKMINDIVFQTKLLSFNASVEAQRAGEAGKGFSVVAEEVGNLAANSGTSAQEIFDIIEKSKSEVENLLVQSKKSVEGLVQDAQDSFQVTQDSILEFKEIFEEVINFSGQLLETQESSKSMANEQKDNMSEMVQASKAIEKSNNENDSLASKNDALSKELMGQVERIGSLSSDLHTLVNPKKKAA